MATVATAHTSKVGELFEGFLFKLSCLGQGLVQVDCDALYIRKSENLDELIIDSIYTKFKYLQRF